MLLVVELSDVQNLMELKKLMRTHSSLCAIMDLGQLFIDKNPRSV